MPRLLVIKTSSLGDVVHGLVAVAEAKRRLPDLEIDWVVEESFVDVPGLFPGVDRIIPVAFRRWKEKPFSVYTHKEKAAAIKQLRARPYDLVIDAQGLIKSAYLVNKARCPRSACWGFDWGSARESIASLAVGQTVQAPAELHAVERLRILFSKALGYPLSEYPYSGPHLAAALMANELQQLCGRMRQLPQDASRWVLLCHGTSREEKAWPGDRWRKLGRELIQRGLIPIYPGGNVEERRRARSFAESTGGVWLPPFGLREIGGILQHVALTVGVDTGLTHWSAALGRPTIALLTATPASRFGLDWSREGATLTGPDITPEEVLAQIDEWQIGLTEA